MKQPHVLAISSNAVHGTASLKTFITVLGEKILTAPSIMLNGLTNMHFALTMLSKNYGGSGDAFLSLFILNHYYKNLPFNDALKLAAEETYQIIKNSIEHHSDDLILELS